MKKDLKELIELAIENKKNAYVPYSHFRVSAVVLTKDGEIFKGINIENASYPATICAERSALSAAISQGKKEIDTLVIVGDSDFTTPCGVCRQFMAEFFDEDTKIVIANSPEEYKIFTMEDLLPSSFNKKDLDK